MGSKGKSGSAGKNGAGKSGKAGLSGKNKATGITKNAVSKNNAPRNTASKTVKNKSISVKASKQATGSINTGKIHTGNTGKIQKHSGNTARIHTGNTGRVHTGNTGRVHTGSTGRIHTGNTGRIHTGNTGKIHQVDFGKPKTPMEGLSILQKIRIFVTALIIVLLLGGALFLVEGFRIRNVRVEGSTHYTPNQIRDMIITDKFCENSLFLKYKLKFKGIDDIPFVEHMDVVIEDRSSIKIIVYEKAVAGYVVYLENKMYFDKDGIVVESSKEDVPGIPEISGLDFDYVILHEPLPVDDPRIFKEILSLTQLLNKNELKADKIYFDYMGDITLYFGGIRVALGDGEYLEERVTHLAAILEEAKPMGFKGKLHMESFTAANPKTSFEIDE